MSTAVLTPPALPPDISQRDLAVNTSKCVLVKAPAGSGKTTLLTKRFLALLSQVSDPRHIVAITFTNAAAAEMRHRILSAITLAASGSPEADPLATSALLQSDIRGWNILEQPALLRISTIDAFCREVALQQPMLSSLGGGLQISDQPEDLYREAARRTLSRLDDGPAELITAISDLLVWRDNSLSELEDQLVTMLSKRDRWMQDFLFDTGLDESTLRASLEAPFAQAVFEGLNDLPNFITPEEWDEVRNHAAFACGNLNGARFSALAQCATFPCPYSPEDEDGLSSSIAASQDLADLLTTKEGQFRRQLTKNEGFPADAKAAKKEMLGFLDRMTRKPGLLNFLVGIEKLPPVHYSEDDWRIVRASFVLLRFTAATLKSVFAEVARVDFIEIAQIAQNALYATDSVAGEGAFSVSQDIVHLLVDEFQDTSRRQHRLLAGVIAHWQEMRGRTCFVVGDPLQSIYFFRDADAELFPRVQNYGLELSDGQTLTFDLAQLTANFRTDPGLVEYLNGFFAKVFEAKDGSGLVHTPAEAARNALDGSPQTDERCKLHFDFVPGAAAFRSRTPEQETAVETAKEAQVKQIVELVKSYSLQIEKAREHKTPFRIAILSRAHKSLIPIAAALRTANIPFRAIDLEPLAGRPEVMDAIGLGRALLNKEDRVAWLGVFRAPWCGLSLAELHQLTSADDPAVSARPIPELAASRLHLLTPDGQKAVLRVIDAATEAAALRASAPTQTLGTWLESVWLRLGGAACVDAQSRANVELLWSVLDGLPNLDQDLVGPAIQSALKKLTAQPDPSASSEYGVQLLTIHKSKGLEFEIVIVPEMQATTGGFRMQMLSWLERGIPDPVASGNLTEFLVAPFQPRGLKGGASKKWVDAVYRDRERQESRRLLYVAATRAREELHFFARPEFRVDNNGDRALIAPADSLLGTAWPALEGVVRDQFACWQPQVQTTQTDEGTAANPRHFPMLQRLPSDFDIAGSVFPGKAQSTGGKDAARHLFSRESGGCESRILGTAVHSLLEQLTSFRYNHPWDQAETFLSQERPRVIAEIRAAGLSRADATKTADDATKIALSTIDDPIGRWILDPHAGAASETRWTSVLDGSLRNVQADRVFLGGDEPMKTGSETWWIIDYKAVHQPTQTPSALATLREMFAAQLGTYSEVLRRMEGTSISIRAGLYYPRMGKFDWWDVGKQPQLVF